MAVAAASAVGDLALAAGAAWVLLAAAEECLAGKAVAFAAVAGIAQAAGPCSVAVAAVALSAASALAGCASFSSRYYAPAVAAAA